MQVKRYALGKRRLLLVVAVPSIPAGKLHLINVILIGYIEVEGSSFL